MYLLFCFSVFDDYIVCLVREELIRIYNNNNLKVPEHILNTTQLKIRGKCDNEVGQFIVQENKQDSEDTCESKSDKQIKRKSEKSHTVEGCEFSLMHKKLKNNSLVSCEEGINIVSIESKQKKRQKKDIIKDDDVGNMNEKNVRTVEKKIRKKKKKLVDTNKVDSAKESKIRSSVTYNNWTVVEDVRKNGMENNLFLEELGQTINAKSKRKKMENRKKVENSNTNMNVKEEDDKDIIDGNSINKDDSLASIEILKKKTKDEKANHNILSVEEQELGGANSRTKKSTQKRRKFEINGESLVNGKKVKLKQNERKSKSKADGGDKQIQHSSDSIDEAKVKKTKNSKRNIVLENLTLSEAGFSWDAKPEDLMVPVGDPAAADDSEEVSY